MTILLGLTGSIGMGKSTTAQLFADQGCAVWDADACVHDLYAQGGAAVKPIGAICPQATVNGYVDRAVLKDWIGSDPGNLKAIEQIVHPLVQQNRKDFAAGTTASIAVFDIPLLFETGAQNTFHATACVYVDADIQRARVLDRGTMTASQLDFILSKQMSIKDKLDMVDYVIPTDTIENATRAVADVLRDLSHRFADA